MFTACRLVSSPLVFWVHPKRVRSPRSSYPLLAAILFGRHRDDTMASRRHPWHTVSRVVRTSSDDADVEVRYAHGHELSQEAPEIWPEDVDGEGCREQRNYRYCAVRCYGRLQDQLSHFRVHPDLLICLVRSSRSSPPAYLRS
ncbi:Uncharacterized protein PBTT_00732 [Plasmodiophora brassicae]